MIRTNDFDLGLYERMAAELLQVAAELRRRQGEVTSTAGSANRLEAYAGAINTNLRVELA